MKATELIKHLGIFGTNPTVRIVKRMELMAERKVVGLDSLKDLEDYCKAFNFKVATFIVKDNTLTINVISSNPDPLQSVSAPKV